MDGSSIIEVAELDGTLATVVLPDGTLEQWSTASLPRGVREGDRVQITTFEGDLTVEVLPRTVPQS